MINHKEFFAEMSVTYLANSYPEVTCVVGAGESIKQQKGGIRQCSPVMTCPVILQRLDKNSSTNDSFSNEIVPHCNKFYPFTKHQLQYYAPQLYKGIKKLWEQIEDWDDPYHQYGITPQLCLEDVKSCCCCFGNGREEEETAGLMEKEEEEMVIMDTIDL
mmetsp:Transcript_8437/g.12406  ORF Transcript_8437/g.12406 Transcript_8437/m.12406 type:complete len:160 (-) Transcript_8437:5-484(-)